MGGEIARRISMAHTCTVFDVDEARMAVARTCVRASNVNEAVRNADVVVTSLPRSVDVEKVVDGILTTPGVLRKRVVWLDTTSGAPSTSRAIATKLAQAGCDYFDVGVAGGPAVASNGGLSAMVGGGCSPETRSVALRILMTFCDKDKITPCGSVGAGHTVKAVNNTLLALNVWASGEAMAVLAKEGVVLERGLDAINAGSGMTRVTQHRFAKHVLSRKFDFGFRMDLMVKDIANCMRIADAQAMPIPVLRLVHQMFLVAQNQCGEKAEHMEAIRVIERAAGVKLESASSSNCAPVCSSDAVEQQHSFSPGPASLPRSAMKRAQAEFRNFGNTGFGAMETTNLSGTSSACSPQVGPDMLRGVETKLRRLLKLPVGYRVLFMWGGAVGQFSAVPMNLLEASSKGGEDGRRYKADYVDSGLWGRRAAEEARKFANVHIAAHFTDGHAIPSRQWAVRPDASYVHVCLNETTIGLELVDDVAWDTESMPPLVADATSTLLSRPIDFSRYGLVYASGGKNLPAGVTVVIVREQLLQSRTAHPHTPAVLDYRQQGADVAVSSPNTPPNIWNIYDGSGLRLHSGDAWRPYQCAVLGGAPRTAFVQCY